MTRRLGRRCSRKPTRRRQRRHGRNAILWRRWPTSFRHVRRRRPRRAAIARRLQPARRLKRAPNRALLSRGPNRAPLRCRRHRCRHPQIPRRPIKASPRWHIASKRRCASPMLRPKRALPRRSRVRNHDKNRDRNRAKRNPLSRPRRPNHSPRRRRHHNRAPPARPSRSRRAAHRQNRPRAPRSTTISNRRWQVCWVARQTRAE